VPIIRKQESRKRPGAAEGAVSSILVGVDQGSQSLHIEEVSVAPNARIPRRINPHTEVAIIVQEGKLDAILGRERVPIGQGDTVLAPAGSAHGFLNRYEEPARLFPNPSGGASGSEHPGRGVGLPVGEGVVWLPIARGPAAERGTLRRTRAGRNDRPVTERSPQIRFARDSPLEGSGFEHSVSRECDRRRGS
jgi:quercetin dioxygenase-like cupin family protein